MSVQSLKPASTSLHGTLEDRLEFRMIFIVALVMFAITALFELALPKRFHSGRGPGVAGIITAARTASTFAFMG